MISEAKARELDFYFYSDHRARSVTTMVSTAIAIMVVFLCRIGGIGIAGTAVLATTSIVGALFVRLVTYQPPAPRRKFKKQNPTENLISEGLLSRRLIIAEVPVALIALCGYLFVPRETEADVIDNHLRRLVHEGRKEEAERLAQAASDAGIPLKPDAAKFVGIASYTPPQSLANFLEPSWKGLSPIELETGDLIYIWSPALYVPNGGGNAAMVTRTLDLSWISMIGDGADVSGLAFAGTTEGLEGALPLFRLTRGMRADVMFYNLFFMGFNFPNPLFFLQVEEGASQIAVVNVHVIKLSQVLDKVIWINTRFEKCTVVFGGGGFKLRNVTFVDCQFSFGPAVPDELKRHLSETQERPIDLNFRM